MRRKKGARRYAFLFVCQQGELEVKALLLAASLRRFLRCEHELIAAIPAPAAQWGTPAAATLRTLRALGARCAPITNPIDPAFRHAHRMAALQIPTTADKLFFLDSDILCMRPFHDEPRFAIPFNAKPADQQVFTRLGGVWEAAYAAAGVAPPALRFPTTVTRQFGLPFFNGGVVAVNANAGLGAAWLACTRRIAVEAAPPAYRYSDRPGLAVAVHQLGLPYDCLDERYNYPLHLKPRDPRDPPYFCHYHWPAVIRREPVVRDAVHALAAQYPAIEGAMAAHPSWHPLMRTPPGGSRPRRHAPRARRGPPDAGTHHHRHRAQWHELPLQSPPSVQQLRRAQRARRGLPAAH